MPAKGTTLVETEMRVQEFARIIAKGGRRSDCIRYAQEKWGVSDDTCDRYLARARDQLRADWEIERPQMIADLLSQCSSLQQEAREAGQFHIALGCINTAARLAEICS
jgi:nucleoside-diphosphate-sugar epimerase